MTEMQRAEINEIVTGILSSVPALEIYLFGSFAKGTEREDSDYDFYVVIPDGGMRAREATWAIRNAISGQTRGIDMLVGTQSKFSKYKDSISFIEREVAETGMKLYG
jgi:predicted nucleotidyltransferase